MEGNTMISIKSRKATRWMLFLIISGALHLSVLLGCPNFVVPPRMSQQLPKLVSAEIMFAIPFIWSVFLLFRYRTVEEH
jgi:hypothetical protein